MDGIEVQQQHNPSAAIPFAVSLATLLLWGTTGDAGALWVAVGIVGLAGGVAGWRSLSSILDPFAAIHQRRCRA